MAKFVVGILVGLVLGLYLDSSAAGGSGQIVSQVETVFKNLLSS